MGTLEYLQTWHYNRLERIPNLQMLTRLKQLSIWGCAILRGWDCTLEHVGVTNDITTTLKELRCHEPMNASSWLYVRECGSLFAFPVLCNFPGLVKLEFSCIQGMPLLSSSVPVTPLQVLDLCGCSDMEALPNLGMLPALQQLELRYCRCFESIAGFEDVFSIEVAFAFRLQGVIDTE